MRRTRKAKLVAAGWRVGDAAGFLGLSAGERAMVETRLALADGVRSRRRAEALSQTELARRLGSSQSRIAKMESADPSVSIDLMVRALYGLGASSRDVARLISNGAPAARTARAVAARTGTKYHNALRRPLLRAAPAAPTPAPPTSRPRR